MNTEKAGGMVPFAFFRSQNSDIPTKLAFTTQPSWSVLVDTNVNTQPSVSVQTASGSTVTTATHSITLAAYKDSTCTTAATAGTLSVTTNPVAASVGVANFAGVKYSVPTTIYLKASAVGLTSACSNRIFVSGAPGTIAYGNSYVSPKTVASCTTTTISTSVPYEFLYARVFDDSGCNGTKSFSGAGLTWTGSGVNYYAVAPTVLTNQSVSFCNNSCGTQDGRYFILSTYTNVDVNDPFGRDVAVNNGISTTASISSTTVRDNSLVLSDVYGPSSAAPITGSGSTVLNGAGIGTAKAGATGHQSTITATRGTTITPSYSLSANVLADTRFLELQPYLPIVSVPTLDKVFTGDNGTGATNFSIPFDLQEANELLLLAVTWRSAVALPSAPTIGGVPMVSVGTISQGTAITTEVFRFMPSSQLTYTGNFLSEVRITLPDASTKSTAVFVAFRGVNVSGTDGSGAIDAVVTSSGSVANPTNNITTSSNNSLVVSFFGNANVATGISAGAGYSTLGTITSSGGGAGGTKATTSLQSGSIVATPSSVAVPWTAPSGDWTKIDIAIKP